ncbi:MAG: hypothetical protein CMF41_02620, partial [Legionellales bacterium]
PEEEVVLSPLSEHSSFTAVTQAKAYCQDDTYDADSRSHQGTNDQKHASGPFEEQLLPQKKQKCEVLNPFPLNGRKFGNSLEDIFQKRQYVTPHLELTKKQIEDFQRRLSIIQILVDLFTKNNILEILRKDRHEMNFHKVFRVFFFDLLKCIGSEKEEFQKYINEEVDAQFTDEMHTIINELDESIEIIKSNPELIFCEYPEEALKDCMQNLNTNSFEDVLSVFKQDKFDMMYNFYQQVGILFKVKFCIEIQQGQTTIATLNYGEQQHPIITLPIVYTTGHFSIHSNMFFTPRDGNCFFHLIAQYLIGMTEYMDNPVKEITSPICCTTSDSTTTSDDTDNDHHSLQSVSLFNTPTIPELFMPLHLKAKEINQKIYIHHVNQEAGHTFLKFTLGSNDTTNIKDIVYYDETFFFSEHLTWDVIDNPEDLLPASTIKNSA